jgi:hypothetical protein
MFKSLIKILWVNNNSIIELLLIFQLILQTFGLKMRREQIKFRFILIEMMN